MTAKFRGVADVDRDLVAAIVERQKWRDSNCVEHAELVADKIDRLLAERAYMCSDPAQD